MGWSAYRKTGLTYHNPNKSFKGFTLLSPPGSASAVLINMAGQVVKRWHFSDFRPGFGKLLPSGNLMITGTLPCKTVSGQPTLQCMEPQNARDSDVIRRINPTQLFPAVTATRAFSTTPHSSVGYTNGELTATEFYKLILAADMGVNYYARENNPMLNRY